MLHEREVYARRPPKAKGAMRPKEKAVQSRLTRDGLRRLPDRSTSWAAGCKTDLHSPLPVRWTFIALEAGLLLGDPQEEMMEDGVSAGRISRADHGCYVSRLFLSDITSVVK